MARKRYNAPQLRSRCFNTPLASKQTNHVLKSLFGRRLRTATMEFAKNVNHQGRPRDNSKRHSSSKSWTESCGGISVDSRVSAVARGELLFDYGSQQLSKFAPRHAVWHCVLVVWCACLRTTLAARLAQVGSRKRWRWSKAVLRSGAFTRFTKLAHLCAGSGVSLLRLFPNSPGLKITLLLREGPRGMPYHQGVPPLFQGRLPVSDAEVFARSHTHRGKLWWRGVNYVKSYA